MQYIRLYCKLVDHRRYLVLSHVQRSLLLSLLCVAGQEAKGSKGRPEDADGMLPLMGLAARVRWKPKAFSEALAGLIESGLFVPVHVAVESCSCRGRIVVAPCSIRVHSWTDLQVGFLASPKSAKTDTTGDENGPVADPSLAGTVPPLLDQTRLDQIDIEHRTPPMPPASGEPSLFPSSVVQPQPEAPKKKRRSRNDPEPPEAPVTDAEITPEFRNVWSYYVVQRKYPEGRRPSRKALAAFLARQAEGYDVATLRHAIAGVEGHDYFGKPGNDTLPFLFRDGERVEQLAAAGRARLEAEEKERKAWLPHGNACAEELETKRIRDLAEQIMRGDLPVGDRA